MATRQSVPAIEHPDYERTVATIRDGLAPDDFAAALDAGRAMMVEQLIAGALDTWPSRPARPTPSRAGRHARRL